METQILKSFTIDHVHNDKQRTFKCWGSVEVKDRAGEIITADEVYKVMDIWMDRGAPIMFNHTNRNVGRGLNWQPLEKNGKPGVLITAKIYDHYSEDDQIWDGIKKGDFEGLSIGGKNYSKEETEEGTFLRNLIGYEFSVVERCGNPEATFEEINMLAKTNKDQEKMAEDKKQKVNKEDEVVDNQNSQKQEGEEQDFQTKAMALFEKINERLDAIEETISGSGSNEEEVEETEDKDKDKEESEDKEVEKNQDKKPGQNQDTQQQFQKSLDDLKKEVQEVKKSVVKEVHKTDRPEQPSQENQGEDFNKRIDKKFEEMKKNGKISFKELGEEINKMKEEELNRKLGQ